MTGAIITAVQKVFGKIFNAGTEFEMGGSQFDRLFAHGDVFDIGNLNVTVIHTPGHTPACVTCVLGDAKLFPAQYQGAAIYKNVINRLSISRLL